MLKISKRSYRNHKNNKSLTIPKTLGCFAQIFSHVALTEFYVFNKNMVFFVVAFIHVTDYFKDGKN